MKTFIILAVFLGAAFAGEKYTTENDNFDIDALVADVKKLREFNDCYIDKGPCDDVAAHFKKDLGEAIEQGCAKCTDLQKRMLRIYLAALNKKLPAEYDQLKAKYDPQDKFFGPLKKAIE